MMAGPDGKPVFCYLLPRGSDTSRKGGSHSGPAGWKLKHPRRALWGPWAPKSKKA